MALVIRLQRIGKPKQAYYRLVAIEKSRGASGRPVEILGSYNPRGDKPAEKVAFDADRYDYWVKKGAKPSETVAHLVAGALKAKGAPAGASK